NAKIARTHTRNSLKVTSCKSSIGLPPILRLPFRMQCLVFLGSGRGLRLRTPRLGRRKPCFDDRFGLAPRDFVDAPGGDLLDEELGEGPYQSIDAIRRKHSARTIEISGKSALLILKRRKRSDVMHAMLFVKCRDGFGSHNFAATRVHCRIADVWVHHAHGGLDHVAAIVHLGDNAISFVLAVETDCSARPFCWRISA